MRPAKPEFQKAIATGVSLYRAQRQKFIALGGSAWLQRVIDAAPEPRMPVTNVDLARWQAIIDPAPATAHGVRSYTVKNAAMTNAVETMLEVVGKMHETRRRPGPIPGKSKPAMQGVVGKPRARKATP